MNSQSQLLLSNSQVTPASGGDPNAVLKKVLDELLELSKKKLTGLKQKPLLPIAKLQDSKPTN